MPERALDIEESLVRSAAENNHSRKHLTLLCQVPSNTFVSHVIKPWRPEHECRNPREINGLSLVIGHLLSMGKMPETA